jgi:hypothetical protein
VLDTVVRLLETDKSKDVRTAIVTSLPLSASTLTVLLARVRDISPHVSATYASKWHHDHQCTVISDVFVA